MLLERAANAGVQLAVHVLVQRGKQFFTFHGYLAGEIKVRLCKRQLQEPAF